MLYSSNEHIFCTLINLSYKNKAKYTITAHGKIKEVNFGLYFALYLSYILKHQIANITA